MSDREEIHNSHVADDIYNSESEEFAFKMTPATSPATSPDLITRIDLQEIIEGWEEKFHKLIEGVRAIEQGTEEVHAHMDIVMRENRAHDNDQLATNNQIKQIQEGLARFMERCDPVHPTPMYTPLCDTLRAQDEHAYHAVGSSSKVSVGIFLRVPVNQAAPTEPTRGNGGHDLSQQPMHEDGHGNSGDTKHPPMNNSSGINNSASHPSSSPKVPLFDGTVSAQFRSWLIQFEAIARH